MRNIDVQLKNDHTRLTARISQKYGKLSSSVQYHEDRDRETGDLIC